MTERINKWYVFFKYGIMSSKTVTYFVVIEVSYLVHWLVLHIESLRCHGEKIVKILSYFVQSPSKKLLTKARNQKTCRRL